MATPTLSSTPTIIDSAESTSAWGGDSFSLETDIKVAGSNSVACAITSTGANDVYVSGSWNFSTDVHLRLWVNTTNVPYIDTESNNGIQIFLYDGSNTAYWTVGGSDTYSGGWRQFILYTGNTPTSGTVTKSSITRIGMRFNNASRPKNVVNSWFDQWTYGDGYTVTGGTSSDPITWSGIAALDAASAYGIVTEVDGVIFLAGKVSIGNGSTATYLEDTGDVLVFRDRPVSSSLYQIVGQGTGCDIDISGGILTAAGGQNFVFDMDDADLASLSMENKQFSNAGLIYFKSGQSITYCAFDSCGQITPSTATFENNTIANYSGTDGGIVWPGGTSVKNCSFINNTRAVEITQTANQTFDALLFSGNTYDVHLDNGGSNINVSKNNGSNPSTYVATGGGTVTFVGASVTVKVTVQTGTGTKIENARVFLPVSATASGGLPFEASVSISNSGTTATVTHTSHGLATGDKVLIEGAGYTANNGVHTITVTGTNAYTYTMSSSPGDGSVSGTITSTFVFLSGLTDSNGVINLSRVLPANQDAAGWARKSSSAPYYKTGPVAGTVSSSADTSFTAILTADQ